MLFLRRALRIAGKTVLWFLGGLAVLWCLLYGIFSFQLNGALARMKRELYPVSVEQLTRVVPVGENAAPSYCEAFALLTSPGDRFEVNVRPGTLTGEVTGLNDLWARRIMRNQSLTPLEKKKVSSILTSPPIKKALGLIEDDSRKRDCDFHLKWSLGLGMLMPHLALVRSAARLVAFQAMATAEAGNPDRAYDLILTGLRMSNHLREPLLTSELVRIACDTILITALERITDRAAISSDRARQIRQELAGHRDPLAFKRVIAGERVVGILAMREIMATGGSPKALTTGTSDTELPPGLRKAFVIAWLPFHKKDLATYITLFADWEETVVQAPYYAVPPAYTMENRLRRVPKMFYLTRTFLPAMDRVRMMEAQHQALMDVAAVAMEVKIHRNKYRTYPETLEDLAPETLAELPPDPFSGRPLIYRRVGPGFIVYSVGPNLKDDQGKRKVPDDYGNEYDIVCLNTR